jgi:hypothetical protein
MPMTSNSVRQEGAREQEDAQMKALAYNLRGFGREGRRTQLRDYMRNNRLDILGLQ